MSVIRPRFPRPLIAVLATLALALPDTAPAGPTISFTPEQVSQGREVYKEHCQICHGTHLSNGQFGTPLKGAFFHITWRGRTLGELLRFTRESMPPEKSAPIADEAYAQVIAFILSENGLAAGETALPSSAEALDEIALPW